MARRARQHWLAKTEPETFAWEQLVRDGHARWDGVRNFTARNHLRALRRPVGLGEIKAQRALQALALVRQPRLSVMPLPRAAGERILALSRARVASV